MKKKWLVGLVALVLAAGATVSAIKWCNHSGNGSTEFTTAAIERGEIVNSITSTGTINPVSTVDVGTQVSGIINKLYVDFNDTVTKGQLIAELDRTILSGALDEAIALHTRAQAQYDLAKGEYQRNEPLYKKGFISEQEFARLRTDYLTQEATLQSAEATVKKARINLKYATITSPITGTVIQRNIEVGQTVAASFSAPTLFVIAEDLRRMQILASVDEADIGVIKKGQEVRYNVQAFPERKFTGVVEQIRLQPTVAQNVVTYTVVITTENNDGILMPGMTATVDFIVEKTTDALMVPNAALRFHPAGDSTAGLSRVPGNDKRKMNFKASGAKMRGDSSVTALSPHFRKHDKDSTGGKRAVIWISSSGMQPRPIHVQTGITDGKMTEISSREDLAEGLLVITGVRTTTKKKAKSVSLLPQPGRPGGRH